MENIIHDYLSEFYTIASVSDTSKKLILLDFDVIARHNTTHAYTKNDIVYGKELLSELRQVFYIDKGELKKYINSWANLTRKVNLKWYWNQEKPWLPLVSRLVADTISSDLLLVQPMSGPTGTLVYLDHIINNNIREVLSNIENIDINNVDVELSGSTLNVNVEIKPKFDIQHIEISFGKNNFGNIEI